MVSRLLEREFQATKAGLAAACKNANSLKLDTKDWEKLNESNAW